LQKQIARREIVIVVDHNPALEDELEDWRPMTSASPTIAASVASLTPVTPASPAKGEIMPS
jgi:hypothetical protein